MSLIPRRMAHFGATNYTFVWWLGRKWFCRPLNKTMREWLGVPASDRDSGPEA